MNYGRTYWCNDVLYIVMCTASENPEGELSVRGWVRVVTRMEYEKLHSIDGGDMPHPTPFSYRLAPDTISQDVEVASGSRKVILRDTRDEIILFVPDVTGCWCYCGPVFSRSL